MPNNVVRPSGWPRQAAAPRCSCTDPALAPVRINGASRAASFHAAGADPRWRMAPWSSKIRCAGNLAAGFRARSVRSRGANKADQSLGSARLRSPSMPRLAETPPVVRCQHRDVRRRLAHARQRAEVLAICISENRPACARRRWQRSTPAGAVLKCVSAARVNYPPPPHRAAHVAESKAQAVGGAALEQAVHRDRASFAGLLLRGGCGRRIS